MFAEENIEFDEREKTICQFVKLMTKSNPYNKPFDKLTYKAYCVALKGIDLEIIGNAVQELIANGGDFIPTASKIRDTCYKIMLPSVPTVAEAWENAMAVIRKWSNYYDYEIRPNGNPVYAHPLIERAVQAFGYRELQYSDNRDAAFAHFKQIYEQLSTRAQDEVRMLPETKEVHNRLVGDAQKLLLDKWSETK